MSLFKYVNRLRRMDDLIRRKGTGTAIEFANKLSISRSQLLQDLKELKELGAPIEYDSSKQSYYYSEEYVLAPGFIINGQYIRGGSAPCQAFRAKSLQLYITVILVSLGIQLHGQVKGLVLDSKTNKPIPGVEVFIHGESVSAYTGVDGHFELDGVPPGFAEVVLYKRGYDLFKSTMRISSGKLYSLNLSINPEKRRKRGEFHKADSKMIARLKGVLFGSEHIDEFQIENEEAISFVPGNLPTQMVVDNPILITSASIGYQIKYYLASGLVNGSSFQLRGYFTFTPMTPRSSSEAISWAKARLDIYNGSITEFLKDICANNLMTDGYTIIKRSGDAVDVNSIATKSIDGFFNLEMPDTFYVHHSKLDGSKEMSKMYIGGRMMVNSAGIPLNQSVIYVNGNMAKYDNLFPLPKSYVPEIPKMQDFLKFYEQLYIHTDKPYYYPGEPLWFKGYVNFYQPSLRDSLSKVAYVEIIDQRKTIILTRMVRIDSGLFNGDFILPDTLLKGDYILRAYTQLQRNYGEEFLFARPLPILAMNEKVNLPQVGLNDVEDKNLKVSFDKPEYSTGEKITVHLSVTDSLSTPIIANLSVSVTDIVQVVPIEEPYHIKLDYPIHVRSDANVRFQYPVEYGFGYQAKFRNERGRPEKTSLSIIQLEPPNARFVETDETGVFSEGGFLFYDSAKFSFKSDKAADAPYGKIEILPRAIPEIYWPGTYTKIDLVSTDSPQRIISEYEVPKDSKLLETIEIKASRIPQEEASDPNYRVRRPYGKPDFVLSKKDLRLELGYGNLVYFLQGKVPGLSAGMTFTRASAQSINFSSGPLVMLNDVPLQGNATEVLATIDPNIVESVEFTKRVNVLYGSQGAFGVISVYTTKGEQTAVKKDPNFQDVTIYGFNRSRKFRYPEHSSTQKENVFPDFRSLIYWNPNVTTSKTTGSAKIAFPASDLPGKYRVCVNGITQEGKPIEAIAYITIATKD